MIFGKLIMHASTTEKYLHQLGLNDDLKNELQTFIPELKN